MGNNPWLVSEVWPELCFLSCLSFSGIRSFWILSGLALFQDGSSYRSNWDEFNFYERAILGGLEPTYSVTVVFSSRIESAHRCTSVVPVNAPLKLSTPRASRDENSVWVKRHMFGLENVLEISYECFEREVLKDFSAIESSHKGNKGTLGSIKKRQGAGLKEFGNSSI